MGWFIKKRNKYLLLPLFWAGWAGSVQAGPPGAVRQVFIDDTYTSSVTGWGISHFQTLDDAAPIEPGTAVYIADGMSLQVTGSLNLDGCFIDCTSSNGSYTVAVESGAAYQMLRTLLSGCDTFSVKSSDVEIQSCLFYGTTIQIDASATGVQFFHNVLADGATLADDGSGTVTDVDVWSNTDAFSNAWNRISVDWLAAGLAPARTLHEDGLFLQPGDFAEMKIMLSNLFLPVAGCELLLGYDATLMTNTTLTLSDPWSFDLAEIRSNGTLNAAIGIGLDAPLEGTHDDGAVAELAFQALETEGRALVFFRQADGLWDNRLTSDTNGNSGVYLSPFTVNSKTVTVDGTAPLLQPLQVEQNGTSLLAGGARASTGEVIVTLDAVDGLAGLADASISVSPPLGIGSAELSEEGATNRFVWAVEITDTTPSGVYAAETVATDRSGNTATNLAEFTVGRPPLQLIVEMQGAVSSAYDFDVTIQALDSSGSELKSWTVSSSFLERESPIEINGVPDNTAFLTADTAVTLRRRLPVHFLAGQWSVNDFIGDHALPGGDLNGDHIINSYDYLLFRQNFQTSENAADINRDEIVNSLDYLIMRQNWQQVGE